MNAVPVKKLFMILVGCRPPGRFTEQHDIFFCVGENLKSIVNDLVAFWPEAKGRIHIDAWREVNSVDGHAIEVVPVGAAVKREKGLFFLNLGGYQPDAFEERHYMMLVVDDTKAAAIKKGKETAFYKHMGFAGATSHIDDKYGVAIDDVFEIEEILSEKFRNQYALNIFPSENLKEDVLHLGYLPLRNIR